MFMVDHAALGGWTEQRPPDPEFFFWFDLTVMNLVCPECLDEGRGAYLMQQHDENVPHYHCPNCNAALANRQLIPLLGPGMPVRPSNLN